MSANGAMLPDLTVGLKMKTTIDTVTKTITFTFDQASAPGCAPLVFDTTNPAIHADNCAYATLHGFMSRLKDAAALSRNNPDGSVRNITEHMRREAIANLAKHYESGSADWNVRTATAKIAPQNPVIAAIALKRGITYAAAEAFLADQFLSEI